VAARHLCVLIDSFVATSITFASPATFRSAREGTGNTYVLVLEYFYSNSIEVVLYINLPLMTIWTHLSDFFFFLRTRPRLERLLRVFFSFQVCYSCFPVTQEGKSGAMLFEAQSVS